MNKDKKKQKDQFLNLLYSSSSKHNKENRPQRRQNSLKHKYSLSDPFKTIQPNMKSFLDFSISPTYKNRKSPILATTTLNTKPSQDMQKKQIKNEISNKITEVTEKSLIPFFTSRLNSLEANFNKQLKSMKTIIHQQNKQLELLRKKVGNSDKSAQTFINAGTSPIREQQKSEEQQQGLRKLNRLLEVFENNIELQKKKTKCELNNIENNVEKLGRVTQEYIGKLLKVTETFNENFVELEGRMEKVEKVFRPMKE